MCSKIVMSQNYIDTFNTGRDIASRLKIGHIITLNGDLGAGKTALTKGICDFFGVDNVTSPTFAIMNIYEFPETNGISKIHHFDTYRLDNDSWEGGGFREFLYEEKTISIIEWAKNINLTGHVDIEINYDNIDNSNYNENQRIITMTSTYEKI